MLSRTAARSGGLDRLLHVEPLRRGEQAGRFAELHASARVWVIGHGVPVLHPYTFALQFLHVFEVLLELHADHGHVIGGEMLLGGRLPDHAGVLALMPHEQQVRAANGQGDRRGNENLLPGPQVRLRESYYRDWMSRMRAVTPRPNDSLNVPNCGESTTLFTTSGLRRSVAFSMMPRSPR